MRSWFAVLAVTLAIAVPTAGHAETTGAASVDEAWAKAMKAGDLEAVAACYAPDAIVWPPGGPEARGTQAIRATFEHLLAGNVVEDVAFLDTHYETAGDTSVGWGKIVLTLKPKQGGEPLVAKARFTEVAKLQGGRWVYVVDHVSAEPDPPSKPGG